MADVTTIKAQIDSLKAIRNSGVLSLRSDNDTTQFRTLEDINRVIASLEIELAEKSGIPRKRCPRYVTQCGRGF